MSLYRKERSPYWYYSFQIDGLKFIGSTRTKDKRAAAAIEAARRTEVALGRADKRRQPMTVSDAFGRYNTEHAQFLASANVTFGKLSILEDGLGTKRFLSDVDSSCLTEYIAKRRATVSNSTVNRDLTILRAVIRRADKVWKVDVGQEVAWGELWLKEPPHRERYLSGDEQERLFEALRPELRTVVEFSLLCGVRLENALMLEWKQVNLNRRTLTFVVKGGKNLSLPITDAMLVLLANEKGKHETRVFTYENRRKRQGVTIGERIPFSTGGWRKDWKDALASAEIENFRWHDLRHTAATRVLSATGSLPLVKKMLGHADVKTTMRYAHVMDHDLRDGMEAASCKNKVHYSSTKKVRII